MRDTIRNVLKFLILILLNLCVAGLATLLAARGADIPTLSQTGSRGGEVTQIQQRLQTLGYYSGEVDGVFGSRTAEAVRRYQQAKGLTVDGIAGPQTLRALGIGASTNSAGGSSGSDYDLLARMISAESRGEPYAGQVAVGAVILNRVQHPSFPDSIAGVIYQPGAFSAIDDGQFNETVAESAYRAAKDAMNGSDPSGGSIYYYNPKRAINQWIRSRPVIATIGRHVFCQ